MTEVTEPGGRPPNRPGSLYRKLRKIGVVLAILASIGTVVKHGHDMWNWLSPSFAAPVTEASE